MFTNLFRFLILFIGVLITTYFIHIWFIKYLSVQNNSYILDFSYIFNGVYTILLLVVIIALSKRLQDQIGFIFLGGSLVKMGVFLAISKFQNFEIDKSVFLDFFIPYCISLVLEVYYVSKLLNSIK